MNTSFKFAVGLALTTALAAGCSNDPPSRSGGDVAPVTLSAVWGQGAAGVGGDVLQQIVTSTGTSPVHVTEPPAEPPGSTTDEQDAVTKLQSGDADVTVVRAGVLQGLGVKSVTPLGLPFLVRNEQQATAIAADTDLVEGLFAGLDDAALVGLALVPGGLRHPFAYGDKPLLGADDYKGMAINTRRDAGAKAMLEALGAVADYTVDDDRATRASDGRLRGIEASMQQIQAVVGPAVQTGNVTLYTKFDVVLVRKAAWDALSAAQQDALRKSVSSAAATASTARIGETPGQAKWCEGAVSQTVVADAKALASLHTALDPITAAAEQDSALAPLVQKMRAHHDGTADPIVTACKGPVLDTTGPVEPRGAQTLIDGTWRLVVDEKHLRERGVPAHDAAANAGVWQFTIQDGYFEDTQPDGRPCNGQFFLDDHQVTLDFGVNGTDTCGGVATGTWRIEGDKLFLDWTSELEYDVLLDQAMFEVGMVKVG